MESETQMLQVRVHRMHDADRRLGLITMGHGTIIKFHSLSLTDLFSLRETPRLFRLIIHRAERSSVVVDTLEELYQQHYAPKMSLAICSYQVYKPFSRTVVLSSYADSQQQCCIRRPELQMPGSVWHWSAMGPIYTDMLLRLSRHCNLLSRRRVHLWPKPTMLSLGKQLLG